MSIYWQYFKYVMKHKKNVFIECWEAKEYIHAFTHDLSKFRPSEFIPYARYFYSDKDKYQDSFDRAWKLHYSRNRHHPEHFGPTEYMGMNNVKHMICDLKAMSRAFGGTAQKYYLENYYKWDMNVYTRYYLEVRLGLLEYNAPIGEGNKEYWMTIEQLIKSSEAQHMRNGVTSHNLVKETINDLLKHACDKYNVDIYELVSRDYTSKEAC